MYYNFFFFWICAVHLQTEDPLLFFHYEKYSAINFHSLNIYDV